MSEWLLPATVLLIALGSTYLFCLRPMRNGGCAGRTTTSCNGSSDLDRALLQARQELQRSREECGPQPTRPQADRHRPDASPTAAVAPSAAVSSGEKPHA